MNPQFPAPSHTILHISDTHFVEDDALLHEKIDSDANLVRLFEGLRASSITPDALVFTGDLADAGQPEAYARLRAIVEPVCEQYGAELIWIMGNHDARPEFRRGLLDLEPTQESVDRVFDIKGLRLIALDSTVPGHHHGELSDEQLDWLAGELATPAEHGTLIGLHHPPIPSPLGLISLVELKDQQRFADVVAGTDVRGVLGGHLHYSTTSTFAGGVPVSVASATCYTQDLQVVFPGARGMDGAQGYNLVHVYDDRVLHTVVPIGAHPTVYEMTPEILEAFMAKSADEQAQMVDAASRTEDADALVGSAPSAG
ncbi:3',5'-cyclic adenosine monophosphate phosphodiesterase CpdA [Microbacterium nanhaiense]|uniref:3',5'-cyclic adenosine monophosphate phosphodiesterase CpdA n=1 Tax=Microbacterium nanhaiense TaxID=1301026 RepID=A0ABQ2N2I2_9MICO|nr:phosphodiesterase [Microbacterium nanhaiense]GGO66106.1 3',5'-cyclic adenosine monophosphate phosphodiesterase CpdA [Microbacterium nanhaiense]